MSKIQQEKSAHIAYYTDGIDVFNCTIYYITPHFRKLYSFPADVCYEIADVIIAEEWRGHGLAKKYLREIIAHYSKPGKSIFLWTLTDNKIAIHLYESLGFKHVNVVISPKLKRLYLKINPWIKSDIIGMTLYCI